MLSFFFFRDFLRNDLDMYLGSSVLLDDGDDLIDFVGCLVRFLIVLLLLWFGGFGVFGMDFMFFSYLNFWGL